MKLAEGLAHRRTTAYWFASVTSSEVFSETSFHASVAPTEVAKRNSPICFGHMDRRIEATKPIGTIKIHLTLL